MIWLDPALKWAAEPTGKRGRNPTFSDAAIQFCLTIKCLFGLALRQATGMVESLLRLANLDWVVPDSSTISRRQKTLEVTIPARQSQGGARDFERQVAELQVRAAILNRFTQLGTPTTVRVG